jgi:hypothetical protein
VVGVLQFAMQTTRLVRPRFLHATLADLARLGRANPPAGRRRPSPANQPRRRRSIIATRGRTRRARTQVSHSSAASKSAEISRLSVVTLVLSAGAWARQVRAAPKSDQSRDARHHRPAQRRGRALNGALEQHLALHLGNITGRPERDG